MKLNYFFFIIVFLLSCSFDDKSGIWKNENNILLKKKDNPFKNFEKFSTKEQVFNEIVLLKNDFKFNTSPAKLNSDWVDIFSSRNNNYSNLIFRNSSLIQSKTKILTRKRASNYILMKDNYFVISDFKGNIIIYSDTDSTVTKFNFYKKKYKNIEKKLNLVIEKNIIFTSDNLGYLYAFDHIQNKVVWAKKYSKPFRSNLKINEDKLIASNQNNELIFFNKKSGQVIKTIPTEENVIKNKFVNNLSLNKDNLYFLNSFGSLYSVNLESMEINWFINLNQSTDFNPSNLFLGSQIVNERGKIVISSNQKTYIINSKNGSIISKHNFSTNIRPIIYNDYIFLITKNDLLICMDVTNSKILYSYNINQIIADYINTKKKNVFIKSYFILNNKLFIFFQKFYYLKLELNGNLIELKKLPSKMTSQPIVINGSLIYLSTKNRLVMLN